MQLKAAAALVVTLAVAAHLMGETAPAPGSQFAAIGAPTSGLPSSPGNATAGTGTGVVPPDVANKQCPKPQSDQYVYRSDKPRNGPFSENGKMYLNLYGKPCEGPLIKAFCKAENDCDGKMAGSKCSIEGKWTDCKAPENVRVASSDASAIAGLNQPPAANTPPQTAVPPQTNTPATSQQLADAYKPEPAAQTPAPAQSTSPANPPATSRPSTVEQIAQSGAPIANAAPAAQSSTQIAGLNQPPTLNPSLAQSQSTNLGQPLPTTPPGALPPAPRPAQPAPVPAPAPSNNGQFWNPSAWRNTGATPAPAPRANGGSSFFSTITNFIGSIAQSFYPSQPPAQSIVVQVVQPPVRPVVIVSPTAPAPSRGTPSNPTLVPDRGVISYGTSSSLDVSDQSRPSPSPRTQSTLVIAPPAIAEFLAPEPVRIQFLESAVSAIGTSTILRTQPAADTSTPLLFTDIGSSTALIRDNLVRKAAIVPTTTVARTEFKAASTTARSTSFIDSFFAISIPDILEAISEGSVEFIRKFLTRAESENSPSSPSSTLRRGEGGVSPVTANTLPQSAADPLPTAPTEEPTGVADSANMGTISNPVDEKVVLDTRVFFSVSPTHRIETQTALSSGDTTYAAVPVPEPREDTVETPSFARLVVQNGVKEIKNLFATLWRFILPPQK